MNLIEQLAAARRMRGALTGSADQEPEKAPPKYCLGKLDDNRPCRIVVIHGDYCRRHQKEIDALEAGAPLPPGRIERQASEEKEMEKHRCNKKGCGRSVKNEGDSCWQHKGLEDQVEAGVVETNTGEVQRRSLDDATVEEWDAAAAASRDAASQIPLQQSPPQEEAEVSPEPASALSRLLKPIQPPQPPLPATSIVLDFDQDEFAAIHNEKVTVQDIKDLVLLLIAGELGRVVEVEDPLAKSRVHASL